jgi:hypothetical protein
LTLLFSTFYLDGISVKEGFLPKKGQFLERVFCFASGLQHFRFKLKMLKPIDFRMLSEIEIYSWKK